MNATGTGGCQCGRVRYTVDLAESDAYLCHCRMCRRATGGASIAFVGVPRAAVTWAREPDWYRSSPIAERPFCSACGTPLGFRFVDGQGNIDLTLGSLDDPAGFEPTHNRRSRACCPRGRIRRTCPRCDPTRIRTSRPAGWTRLASSPTELPVQRFAAADGVRLAWRELGEGRPVVLLHGYFSNAQINWIKYGHAGRLAAAGFRVILPDLRGHGDSDRPHDPAAYPPDILADDGLALIAHLGLTDYDLGGYSLGGRTSVRMLARGAAPRRAVIAGMGLAGLLHTAGRGTFFRRVLTNLGTFERGSAEWMSEAFLKTTGGDPAALLRVLDTFVDTPEADLRRIALPVLALGGVDDDDNGSIAALADVLRDVRVATVPGNHMSAVVRRELGQEIADFLAGA